MTAMARILTVAGSDSGGGAGIEADLKTIAALGGYGMAAITSITAQNTVTVSRIYDLPPEEVAGQMAAVLSDIGADAMKTGMLSNENIIGAITEVLQQYPVEKLVIDPVMISKSGAALLQESAQQALQDKLFPLAYLVTPNVPEAEVLSGVKIASETDMAKAAQRILQLGAKMVLMKGGHLSGEQAVDCLFSGDGELLCRVSSKRIETKNTHGTGCTFSAALACLLGQGMEAVEAAETAKEFLTGAILQALPLGAGHGPLHHLYRFFDADGQLRR